MSDAREHLLTITAQSRYANYTVTMVVVGASIRIYPWVMECNGYYTHKDTRF
jgi:hypothetical protein